MATAVGASSRVFMHATPDKPGADALPSSQDGLQLDVERYRAYLDGMDLSDAQVTEMLNALWSILSAFVDVAFGVDSVHLARPQAKEGRSETDIAAEYSTPAQQPGNHATKDIRS